MPTAKPRIQVTLTDELSRALGVAQGIWPDLARSEQISRLARTGAVAIEQEGAWRRERRRAAAARCRDGIGGAYPPGYLDELRRDWPA